MIPASYTAQMGFSSMVMEYPAADILVPFLRFHLPKKSAHDDKVTLV